MTDQHPITPPLELLEYWERQYFYNSKKYDVLLIQSYQSGADAELEACCKWIAAFNHGKLYFDDELRSHRRPKSPSLKEQAMAELAEWENVMDIASDSPIRRALEALPDD